MQVHFPLFKSSTTSYTHWILHLWKSSSMQSKQTQKWKANKNKNRQKKCEIYLYVI